MRIWHEKLIPYLCRQHLLACWREGLGAYKIITENKKGYRNHPAVKEFERHPELLWYRLEDIRDEMLKRGYKPKETPSCVSGPPGLEKLIPWQSLEQQIEVLKNKKCQCAINLIQ